MKKTVSVIAISCLTLLAGCSNQGDDQTAQQATQPAAEQAAAPAAAAPANHAAMPGHNPAHQGAAGNQHNAKVIGVTHAAGYSYMEIEMDGKNTWIAASPVSVKTGDTIAWAGGAVMQNFTSKSLRQTFPEIIPGDINLYFFQEA